MLNDNIERLKSVLLNETPILFLGAGFALGAKNKTGRDIPKGNELKKIIIEEFLKFNPTNKEYEELMSYSLSQVCQYCSNKQSPDYLNDFLTDFFSQVNPSEIHLKLTNYFWKKIYSTNIDDLVENVFKINEKEIVVQHYVRKFTFKKNNATEYFKLHGSVNNPSEGFTFSTDDYIDTMIQSKDYRFSSLSSDMHSENFILLGSNFEEINLDYYFKLYENTGYASSRGKIFVINPKPSMLLRSKIERIQGILVEWDSKEFFDFIDTITAYKKSITHYDLDRDIQNLGFINIKNIRDSFIDTKNYDSKLYLGYEPEWKDVFSDWDFIDNRIQNISSVFVHNAKNIKAGVLSLYGKSYIGKSTFLKRVGSDLRVRGYETFYFMGKNFNYYPFLQYIKKSDHLTFALIVDNAGYYYGPIKLLMKAIPPGKRILIVTASRPFFHFKWRYNLVGEFFSEFLLEPTITKEYALSIVNKLHEKGYLGELKNLPTVDERVESVMRNNDVMSFLFSLTYGKGFVKRLNKDLQPFLENDDSTKDLLVGLAIFNRLELPHFPHELISHFTNNRAKEYIKKIDGFTKTTNDNNLQLRSGFFTTSILSSVSISKIITHLEEILIRISAQVDDKSHTYWNEIHASLTKEKTLRKVLGLNSHQIKHLLYGIRGYYSENFNFWLQLGIAEQREKDFEKALNHFKQAEALRPSSYMVQNAIGRNFMKQANSIETLHLAKKYYTEGEQILLNLIENREELQARAFSTHTYLYEKILFVQKFHVKLSNHEILKMNDYLKRITDKDPNDIMAKHISNVFIRFLKKIDKTSLIRIDIQDLSRLKALFIDYNIDLDELIDDLEAE